MRGYHAPGGGKERQRGFAAGEMEPNGGKHRFLRSENRDEIEEVRGGEATRVQPATARAGGLPPSNKPCEEVPRPICHGSGKHRFSRSENRNKVEEVPRPICYGSGKHRFSRSGNRDEIEEVKQNAMSLV